MSNYHIKHSMEKQNRKVVKIRVMAFCAVFLLALYHSPTTKEGFCRQMTSYILPMLTYEIEQGNLNMDYSEGYEVPEWFYEDENQKINTDLAVCDEQTGQNQSNDIVETISSGENRVVFTREQLEHPDFLLSHVFVIDNNTSMTEEELSLGVLMDTNIKVSDLTLSSAQEAKNSKEPKILIYHTHGSESFADSRPGVKEDTIVGVGSYLTRILEETYHIPTYHDETAYDMVNGVLDRSKAYENAYGNITKILQEYPSIQVVIDLHRDGVEEDTRLVTDIDGKPTAKIMFLNGVSRSNLNGEIAYLENPNKKENLAFSFQLYLAGKEYYGDYVRKIYVRSLRYNLHLMPRTTLIEVGAQNNTLEEEKNAMEPLAFLLHKVLKE